MTWHARRAVDLHFERFPDLRYDEDEIRRAPQQLEARGDSLTQILCIITQQRRLIGRVASRSATILATYFLVLDKESENRRSNPANSKADQETGYSFQVETSWRWIVNPAKLVE